MINSISSSSLHHLLGIPVDTPLSIDGMCKKIKPLIYPAPVLSIRLKQFCDALVSGMQLLRITVLSEKDASGDDGRFAPGTVIFAPGYFPDNLLAINRVSTLYNNIIVGIYDEPAPLTSEALPQQRLDTIVRRLARDMVHILIFITDQSWSICTMNGGVVTFNTPYPSPEDIRFTLIPKLTAQVVPPRSKDLDIEYGALRTDTTWFQSIADDFLQCSALWSDNSCLLTHTSTTGLEYRSDFYKRIVTRYLDQRSGMSYGFFARQLPVAVQPAIVEDSCCDCQIEKNRKHKRGSVWIRLQEKSFLVTVPKVRIITTRSGCKKHHIDPEVDLVEIGLSEGRIYLKTPEVVSSGNSAKPSFDTLTIIAHALGNAFSASILKTLKPGSIFPSHLTSFGTSMTHWHDYPPLEMLPNGYYLHGQQNPPVSCSTPQSAAYSLLGKINALEQSLEKGTEYRGDVHIEPNHGTNIVGLLSLAQTAKILNPAVSIDI